MSGLTITTIIDKKAKSWKLINNRPGYDMKYIVIYLQLLLPYTTVNKHPS